MKHCSFMSAITVVIVFVFIIVPVQADIQNQLLDFLGEAELGYQKDADDYLREARKQKAECMEYSRQYDEIRGAELTEGKNKYLFGLTASQATLLLNPNREQRARSVELGWDQDFIKSNLTASSTWYRMKTACAKAEKNYNAAFSQTRSDDYQQQARIFQESADLYDTVGDTDGARQIREAEEVAEERAAARDVGFSDCLIVTAAFGSPMAVEVELVRDFRDDTVKKSYLGSRYVTALNAMYYSFSPAVARSIDENPSVKPAMRIILAPLIGIVLLSQGIYSLLSFSPGIATVVFILSGGVFFGLVYVFPVILFALWVAAKRKWQVPAVGSLKPIVYLWAGLLAALVLGAVMEIDLIAILSSGMLFVCTVLLTAGAVALYLFGYFWEHPVVQDG